MIPYKVFSHYSIQAAFGKPNEYVDKAYDLRLPALCLTDIHSVSGCVEFLRAVKKKNKIGEQKIKPILGCNVRVDLGEVGIGTILLLAQNYKGWKNLLKILGESTSEKAVTVVSLDTIIRHNADLICILGGLESVVGILYTTKAENFTGFPDWKGQDLPSIFAGRFFYSLEDNGLPTEQALNAEILRAIQASGKDIPVIKGQAVYYVEPEDILYQQIILASQLGLTLQDAPQIIQAIPAYAAFFKESTMHLGACTDESSNILFDMVEEYDIAANKPHVPQLRDKNGNFCKDADTYLKELCRIGWKDRKINERTVGDEKLRQIYVDRVTNQLDVLRCAGLSNYVLVARDISDFGKKCGTQVGLRGSAAGCIIFYLLHMSDVDPVRPDPTLPYHPDRELIFSRFYNSARNTKDNISLPDADLDVGISARAPIINYISKKYGPANVGHIITFGRMDGKGAIKEVFRVLHGTPQSFEVANQITKYMVDAARVQDVLEDLRADNPNYNIINYNIEHIKEVETFYREYKKEFDIAIKMANTIRNAGQHAAGIVIANEPLSNLFPSFQHPTDGRWMVALEMADAEYVGAVKYDILGVAAYEKISVVMNMINSGDDMPTIINEDIVIDE